MIPHALFTHPPVLDEHTEGGSTCGWSGTNSRQELGKVQLHKYLSILMYAQTQTSTTNGRKAITRNRPAEKKERAEGPDA